MADDFVLNPGAGGVTARADQLLTGQYVPYGKVMDGTDASTNVWIIDSSGRGKTIADAGTGPWPVTDNGGTLSVDDGGASLTVDGTVAVSGTVTVSVTGTATVAGSGVFHVDDNAGSLTVDNAGTFAVQDSQVVADNGAFTDGTTKVFIGGYILDETAGTALTENDAAAARIDSKRAQVLVVEDATTRGRRATVSSGGALLTDSSATTQPVSAASLPLPTGAATSAKQPALGTAGSPSTDVLTVQGSSSGTPLPVQGLPGTTGGYSISRLLAAASTNATSVKASAGQVYGWYIFNASAATKYLKLYNKASAPTVGTDTPVMTIPIPAGAAANVEYENGIAFGTGIGFALTGGLADADTTALAANDVIVNLLYK